MSGAIDQWMFRRFNVGPESWPTFLAMRNLDRSTRAAVRAVLLDKVRRLITHAHKHCPYYRDIINAAGLEPAHLDEAAQLRSLPILTKRILKDRLEDLRSTAFDRTALIRTGTGGSTGEPTFFYHDRDFLLFISALKYRNLLWTGWQPGDWDFRVWGSAFDVRAMDQVRERIAFRLRKIRTYPAFKIDDEMISRFIADVHRLRPAVIQGYNMPLVEVARRILDQGVNLGYMPKAVINCAETLHPAARETLENGFGAKVYDRYGGREVSDICHECPKGSLHINEDAVLVDAVDDEGRPVPDGQMGHLLLTSLENYGMPFIRYRVEDMGILAPETETCDCGLPFRILRKVLGRSQDIIRLCDGSCVAGELFPHLFKDYDIRKYQVVQERIDFIKVQLVKGSDLTEQRLSHLRANLAKNLPLIEISIELRDDIPVSASGKFRFTISNVPPVNLTQK